MPANIETVENIVASTIGAMKVWGNYDDNPERFKPDYIRNVIKAVDLELASVIAKTPGHPSAGSLYTVSAAIAHEGELPETVGGYMDVRVDGNKAEESMPYEIRRLRSNETVSVDEIEPPYYAIRGKRIYHTGTNATVGHIPTSEEAGGEITLISPIEYTYALVAGALRILFAKDGEDSGLSSDFGQEYKSRLESIKEDAKLGYVREVPPLTMQG